MASKTIDEILKNMPPESRAAIEKMSPETRSAVHQTGQGLDRNGSKAPTPNEYVPMPLDRQGMTRKYASTPNQTLVSQKDQAKKKPNAFTRAQENTARNQAAEPGQDLQKKNVTMDKEPER